MDSAVLANEDLCKVLNAGQMNGMSEYRVWLRSAYRVLRIERFPPLHRLLHGSFCINWGCFDSHVSWQPDILPSIRNKTCINKLRNCAAYYVCSCSLFCKWPWYYDTAHAVFPMNVSWHAKDWSGLTAQNIDSLNQPWYISRMGFIKVVPKQSTSQEKKVLCCIMIRRYSILHWPFHGYPSTMHAWHDAVKPEKVLRL